MSQYDWKMLRLGDATGEFAGLDAVEEITEEEDDDTKLAVVETVVVVEHESVELSRTSLGLVWLDAGCVPILLIWTVDFDMEE